MSIKPLAYAGSATTAIAGILHLIMVPRLIEFNINTGIFLLQVYCSSSGYYLL